MDTCLSYFLAVIREDPRITVVHISLYLALVHQWYKQGSHDPLQVFSWEVMPWCKISGTATYHRCVRELDAYGYIRYVPSFNHHRGSRIYLAIPDNPAASLVKKNRLRQVTIKAGGYPPESPGTNT